MLARKALREQKELPTATLSPPLFLAAADLYANKNCKTCWGKGHVRVNGTVILCNKHGCAIDKIDKDPNVGHNILSHVESCDAAKLHMLKLSIAGGLK
jgi:hypothetical protein